MLPVEAPFKTYTGLDGKPLNNGYVYFGLPDQNPITSPIPAFWDKEGVTPATGIRTINGYIVRAGTPANVFVDGSYSELVQDSKKRQVFYARNSDDFSSTGIISDLADFAGPNGASRMGFKRSGSGTVAKTVQDELEGLEISPDEFGATGTSVFPGDTAAVQAALNDGRPVKFTRDYYVDNVEIGGVGRTVNFNNYALVGCTTYAPDYLLAITGRELNLLQVKVDGNFKPYTNAVRWFSKSAGAPAQYNKVFGLRIVNSTNGLTYGQSVGTPSVDAAQSENTIFGYTTRAVQVPFIGNQSNGFITLVSPVLDCNPYEWTTQPGYNATTWQTAALTFNNRVGSLVTMGGEFLKTTSQLGYGFSGNNVTMLAPTLEIAGSQGYVDGNFTISDNVNGYQSSDSMPAFKVPSGAVGTLNLHNVAFSRGAGVGAYSGAVFIDDTGVTSAFRTIIGGGGNIIEWKWPLGNYRTIYRDVLLTETAALGQRMLGGSNENLLVAKGVDYLCYSTSGWYLKTFSGPGTTMSIAAAGPSGTGYLPLSLQLHATGEAQVTTTDETSASTIIATSIKVRPTELYRISLYGNITVGTNARFVAGFYTAAGAIISPVVFIVDPGTFSAGSFSQVGGILRVPANAAYMGIGVYCTASDIQIADVRISRA